MGRYPLPRRLRAELLTIRDERAAKLIEQLCRRLEEADEHIAALNAEVRELRMAIRRVCAAARLPAWSIDSVDFASPEDRRVRKL
ncbi:MAG: hypothetical protein IT450_03985 [Phycisphaerales bacterium]|nr:hypothetical protein [Phycisphaerales bacterium]